MRYDQFMTFGWKVLIPFSLVWIVAVALIRKLKQEDLLDQQTLVWAAVIAGVLFLVTFLIPEKKPEPEPAEPEDGEFDAFAGGYPVPPPSSTQSSDPDTAKEARR
jgi:NADH-quinone oxidoreductase subunit H